MPRHCMWGCQIGSEITLPVRALNQSEGLRMARKILPVSSKRMGRHENLFSQEY